MEGKIEAQMRRVLMQLSEKERQQNMGLKRQTDRLVRAILSLKALTKKRAVGLE